ncbi:MAG: CC0125/CC1285 family lipoprotein [Pikeienuella sp.]
MRFTIFSMLFVTLVACVGPTNYAPSTGGDGYLVQKLETNKYLVTFKGNSSTKREVVETYFLYRAAETTIEAGHEYFRVVDKNADKETRYQNVSPRVGYGLGIGIGGRTRLGGSVFVNFPVSDLAPISRHEASATIVTFSGERPDDDYVFSAPEVISSLDQTIRRPPAD